MDKIIEVKADLHIDDAGTVSGLAWPFGTPDQVGDVIEKGAFAFPESLPMVMEHDQAKVVGIWTSYSETDAGLEVKGRLFLDGIKPARDAHTALRKGRVSGLSIGFKADGFEVLPTGGRKFNALTITEISLCRRPVHPGARITSVKATPTPEGTRMDPENAETVENEEFNAVEEIKAVNDNFTQLTGRLDKLEARANRPTTPANDNDGPTEERKAFETFLRRGESRMGAEEVKALTVADDAQAGYLAPEEIAQELIKLTVEYSPIRQYARVVTTSASEIKYPRRVSGTGATWVDETEDRTATSPTYEQITLAAHELATYADVSIKLLEDNSYGLESELLGEFAENFGKTEGAAFVKGTGVKQPSGLLTATGIAEVKTGATAGFPTTNPADVLINGMYHGLPSVHAQRGVWLMNRTTLGTIRTWKDGDGRYLVLDPISEGAPLTLLGRPIVEAVDMDDIGAGKAPIVFGDLQGYRIIDRVGLSTLRDPYTLATKGQVRFHARKRVGADVTHPDRFIKLKVGTAA